jgi:pre-mRNA-splicing factor ATP-dependent RNA helicase DHX15/PRP43
VIFNELVSTGRNYIRTVSEVKPEWYVCTFLASHGVTNCSRLLEIAPNYFDISSFPEGETKRALQRVANAGSNGITDAASLLRNLLKRFTFF